MSSAVYNLPIPNMANCHLRSGSALRSILRTVFLVSMACCSWAADWNGPEQQLARKIAGAAGPGAVALSIENRSSLGKRDAEIISNGLRAALESAGLRFVKPDQAVAAIAISLSENPTAYVWVAEIRQSATDSSVVMVSIPRATGSLTSKESVPLTLRKTLLWNQDDQILDVAVLEENPAPSLIAVFSAENVSLYRMQGGQWQQQQALPIAHARPWPRDLRGRLIPGRDHLFDAYLPGVLCRTNTGTPLTLACHNSDDPWPLVASSLAGGGANFPSFGAVAGTPSTLLPESAFFAPTRNFFTGVITPALGKFTTVGKFYSAAFLPRGKYVLWLLASLDGQVHLVDGVSDSVARLKWGSDITSVRTPCGAGWQVLASGAGEAGNESIRAYELPDRDPVAVSTPVELGGEVTALWTEGKGDTAVAIVRNQESGDYEAFRLAITCSQ